MPDAQVCGEYEARFANVCTLLSENVRSGAESGAAISVNVRGRTALNIWGGFRDEERHLPWEQDTIVNVWSVTHLIGTLAALMLVEHGELQLDRPVCHYWPDFAQGGKQGVLVRHVLEHTAGLPGWSEPVTLEDIYDREKSTALLAAQQPWWTPGSASGFHVLTRGHIVGELVQRITGMPIEEFVRDQIAGPLEADFQIGADERDWERIAPITSPSGFARARFPEHTITHRVFSAPGVRFTDANTPAWRNAALSSLGGHGNAQSLARILSTFTLGGEVDGVYLLSPRTIERIFSEQTTGPDQVLGIPIRFGLGFALPHPEGAPHIPAGRICFWGSVGGSIAVMDLDRGVTISYVTNSMQPGILGSSLTRAYVRAIYMGLGVELPECNEPVTEAMVAAAVER